MEDRKMKSSRRTISFGVTSLLALLSLSLAGCSTAGGGSGANVSAVPATGTVVAQSDMPAFCQNAAASKYNAPPDNITTQSPVARSSGLLIQGSAQTDMNSINFDCRFSASGAFLGLITQ